MTSKLTEAAASARYRPFRQAVSPHPFCTAISLGYALHIAGVTAWSGFFTPLPGPERLWNLFCSLLLTSRAFDSHSFPAARLNWRSTVCLAQTPDL